MSKNGSEREFIFSLYEKENPTILEKELNIKLKGLELEPKYAGLKLDMYGIEQDYKVEVFVENVLLKSDASHQERLLKLIENINQGIIIYQAIAFKDEHVKQLKEKVLHSGKKINLMFLTINPELLQPLDILNGQTHKLKVYENLDILNGVSNPVQLQRDISIIQVMKGDKVYKEKRDWDFSKREDENNYLLEQLKQRIPYFLSFQRRKSNLDTLRIIPFGFGKSGVSLMLSVEDMHHWAFVELRFTEDTPPIYYVIKEKEEIIRERIGEELKFIDDDYKIAFHFKPYEDVQETVERLVHITERFIQTFSNDVLYADRKELSRQFGYSL